VFEPVVSRIVAVLCFFFSSRRRHTRFSRDWSSDVCSSDLKGISEAILDHEDSDSVTTPVPPETAKNGTGKYKIRVFDQKANTSRSEERRVGKECRDRWTP